ncbi:beta-galactosidase [Candidatus Saccharibacteria bacterium]|nr:beta-galactosidase [Candidatus Saccharibacteria bacterium]
MRNLKTKPKSKGPKSLFGTVWNYLWRGGWLRRIVFIFLSIMVVFVSGMYGVGQWYIHKHANETIELGATFIPDYAQSFGLDPEDTLTAMLSDLKLKQVRLVSYWSDIEATPGHYDFSKLDWQFALANKYHAMVSLAVGMRQPRWPECHEPDWANIDPNNRQNWEPQLYKYMQAVVAHYKDNPALKDYELENEFFMKVFGECKDFDRSRLVEEFNMVKGMDPNHHIIVSRSDNWIGIPVGKPTPDEFAISIYKRVWDATITHRYFEYPLPSWFYSSLAGAEEIYSGKNMIIHELQAEPWTPKGLDITQTSVEEQYKSMNPQRLKDRIDYGEATGMKTIDLWGAEWWYYMKVKQHNPDVWNVVKQSIQQAEVHNAQLNKS